nr:MAG TPA: hypothetical protein [Crassvirales sp.]
MATIVIIAMAITCVFTNNKDIPIKPVVLGIYVALYGLICFIVSFRAYHEVESERINAYKEYYKNTENMIDAIWELEPEMFDKIDKNQYDTARNKVYKLNHANN